MKSNASTQTGKVIGANGQISIGKQFAGLQLLVEKQEMHFIGYRSYIN